MGKISIDTGEANSMTDISGTWLGTYWQGGAPTRFEMTLVQSGNLLSGNILDDSWLGEALLVGEFVGRNIDFVKRYMTGSRHAVNYTGSIVEERNYMQGQWSVGVFDSGSWEAHRCDDNLCFDVTVRLAKTVPALSRVSDRQAFEISTTLALSSLEIGLNDGSRAFPRSTPLHYRLSTSQGYGF